MDWTIIVPLAQVIGTVGGLLLVWWKVRQIRDVSAFELLRGEEKNFHSPEMRKARAQLARTLQTSRTDFDKIGDDAEPILGFFESLGLLLRRRIVPDYFVWTMMSEEILHYRRLLEGYVFWLRKKTGDKTWYIETELLWTRIANLDKQKSGLESASKEEDLQGFLVDEAKLNQG